MMRDIFDGAVESQADMRLVGHCDDEQLEAAIREHDANVVIVGEGSPAARCRNEGLLLAHPHLKLVILAGAGRSASLVELRRVQLAEPSPRTLIDAIREALDRDDAP
jgi:hypothetical protein